jgi:hypothetical protein
MANSIDIVVTMIIIQIYCVFKRYLGNSLFIFDKSPPRLALMSIRIRDVLSE